MNVLGDDRTCQMIFYILALHHLDMQVHMNMNKSLVLQRIGYFNYKLKQMKIRALGTTLGLKYTSMHFLAKQPEEFLLFMKIKLLTCHFYCSKLHSVLTMISQTDRHHFQVPSIWCNCQNANASWFKLVCDHNKGESVHSLEMCVCVCVDVTIYQYL